MCKIKTNPGSTQVCVYTTLFQTNPGSTQVEPTSRGGLSPVYTAQTNPGSTRLCSHGQIPKTRVNTNLGRTRVSFLHAGQLVAFPGEVIVFCNQVYCFVNSKHAAKFDG